ncbi:MAG: 3-isopropylmalate dehydratase small subunit [Candidatus Coatesbacteria bacterium]|nr:MAG: 3-isopropylmalate dehydratase small subunit [Candidatus Coatesbacteria bacterium]
MVKGKVWKYGDDVNTDVIFPGKYTYTVTDPAEIASHALEDLDPDFAANVKPGDVVVVGRNFGCGSSREQAAFCLKYAGVGAVVAESFARIFYRNAINAGLPMVVSKDAPDALVTGDPVDIDFTAGELRAADGKVFTFPPLPPEVMAIVEAGGLVEYVKRRLNR